MEKWNLLSRFLRLVYQQFFLRFSGQIREPYIIKLDKIAPDLETNELMVSFHVANKRISETLSVTEFVKQDMIYLIDPKAVFYMGQQSGVHAEQLILLEKKHNNIKNKCVSALKRVFIDE